MKVLLAICLVGLLACGHSAKDQARMKCESKNPFLGQMRQDHEFKVGLHIEPVFEETTFCTQEWNEHGSCCQQSSLLRFYENELDKIKKSQAAIEDVISKIKKASDLIVDSIKQKRNVRGQLSEIKASFSDFSNNQIFSTFKKESSQCWDYMNYLRGSAICFTCSGRSEIFFKNNKILIAPETCLKAVANCKPFFSNLRWITQSLDKLTKDSQLMREDSSMKFLFNVTRELERHSPPKDLLSSFKTYTERPDDEVTRGHAASAICSMIVNARKQPFITKMKIGEKIKQAFKLFGLKVSDFFGKKAVKFFKNQVKKAANKALAKVKGGVNKAKDKIKCGLKKAGDKFKNFGSKIKNAFKKSKGKKCEQRDKDNRSQTKIVTKRIDSLSHSDCRSKHRGHSEEDEQPIVHRITIHQSRPTIDQEEQYHNDKNQKNFRGWRRTCKRRDSYRQIDAEEDHETWRDRQLDGLSNPPHSSFSSDTLVMVKISDEMFSAFDGAKGTTVFAEGSPHKPMNMSLTFP